MTRRDVGGETLQARFYSNKRKMMWGSGITSIAIFTWVNWYFFKMDKHKINFESSFIQYYQPMYFYLACAMISVLLGNICVYQFIRFTNNEKEVIELQSQDGFSTSMRFDQDGGDLENEMIEDGELVTSQIKKLARTSSSQGTMQTANGPADKNTKFFIGTNVNKLVHTSSRNLTGNDTTQLYKDVLNIIQKARNETVVRWKTTAYVMQIIISIYLTVLLLVMLCKYQLPAYYDNKCEYLPDTGAPTVGCAFIHSEYIMFGYMFLVSQYVFELGVLNTKMNHSLFAHHVIGAIFVAFVVEYGTISYTDIASPTMLLGILQYVSGIFEQFVFMGMFTYRYFKNYRLASYYMQIGWCQFVISKVFVSTFSIALVIMYFNILGTAKAIVILLANVLLSFIQFLSIRYDFLSIIKHMESFMRYEDRSFIGRCLAGENVPQKKP